MRRIGFGRIACIVAVFCAVSAEAQTLTTLHFFQGNGDGTFPAGSLIFGPGETMLYGTTQAGGHGNYGTVFQISPSGEETVLYRFRSTPDGREPSATLAGGPGNAVYGTTQLGGSAGAGTVFKLARVKNTLQETVVSSFQGGADGLDPSCGLVLDAAGNMYGTTPIGGGTGCGGLGCGTVFKIAPTGQETILYRFEGVPDGANPYRGLVRDSAGNLYGTTGVGGVSNVGTVFMLNANGEETILHNFAGPPDGTFPYAGLLRDAAGNLFGTTGGGGDNPLCPSGCGTVFEITSTGGEVVLYSFSGGADGDDPSGGVVEDKAGNLYGTTAGGGGSPANYCGFLGGCGTVFELDQAGTLTTLHQFNEGDGAGPGATLTLDSSGNLYGTTGGGGSSNFGTVFKLTP